MGRIFDKNSFALGTKLNELKTFLLRVDSTFSLTSRVLLCSQHAQSFIEKSPILGISWACKSNAA